MQGTLQTPWLHRLPGLIPEVLWGESGGGGRALGGTPGMGEPMYQRTLLAADLREDPVPTTSPTRATGCPWGGGE